MALLLMPRDQYMPDAKAPQACGSCKRQKRKCDKALPACGLCTRLERNCDYAEPQQPAPTADDFAAMQLKLLEFESRLNSGGMPSGSGVLAPALGSRSASGSRNSGEGPGSGASMVDTPPAAAVPVFSALEPVWEQPQAPVQFPPDVFLDTATFGWLNKPIQRPFIDVPAEVLQHLGDGNEVQQAIGAYFAAIHPWLPIVSKKRMHMGVALSHGGPDLAMLFLTMKLMATHPPEGLEVSQTPLYRSAKRLASLLEHGGATSLMVLQSMVLIAYFEYAHAVYPAAWITIGACVRYAEFLGLPGFREGNIMLSSPTTWTEMEERKRTWWAILVLDRVVCLGNKKRYISPDPKENESFPVNDEVWDEGRVDRAVHYTVSSTSPPSPPSPFSSLCRAALLTGEVVTNVRSVEEDLKHRPNSAAHHATLAAAASLSTTLFSATDAQPRDLPFLAARCVLLSNAILLHDSYCCPENPDGRLRGPEEKEQQARSIEALRQVGCTVVDLARELFPLVLSVEEGGGGYGGDVGIISPLVLDALYAAANLLAWMAREEGSAECEEGVNAITRCLARLAPRWRLAREYGRMLEEQAFAFAMQDKGQGNIRIR